MTTQIGYYASKGWFVPVSKNKFSSYVTMTTSVIACMLLAYHCYKSLRESCHHTQQLVSSSDQHDTSLQVELFILCDWKYLILKITFRTKKCWLPFCLFLYTCYLLLALLRLTSTIFFPFQFNTETGNVSELSQVWSKVSNIFYHKVTLLGYV